MIDHLGFSYIGAIWLLMLMIPNLIWIKKQPTGYVFKDENKILLAFERVGQVLVVCFSLMVSDLTIGSVRPWSIWLLGSLLLMILYEIWWIRYFRSARSMEDFHKSLFGIPVAGATLLVLAFLLLGIYGKVMWLIISVIIFGIGHIGIHLMHQQELKKQNK